MVSCRIYLFTYKRNHLLPRAVESLINQTFQNWVCELHNDCPDDPFPAAYTESLNDPRFIMKNHTVNMGAVAGFNLAFAGCTEHYASILEDDNWWEPTFLEEMIALMENRPAVNISWSNMNLWQEKAGNEWQNTGNTIWPASAHTTTFSWPAQQQAISALHSTGAMLYRGKYAHHYIAPHETLLNAIELVRERAFEHPIILNHKPLANFAITINTNRSADPYPWIASQVMLLASYIEASGNDVAIIKEALSYHRQLKPNPMVNFFLADLFLLKNRSLYQYFNLSDWMVIGKWLIRNGHKLNYIKTYLASQKATYIFLLKHTRLRFQESKQNIH
ncbi:Glycosyltransferase involved in cell wall bisynthesis [Mucilaginibacter lappiensis]|uniref:Glycosyltransferase involved in cell wall biosynthesis n=1 Tax=Mucilaginibacter lappiensis TaxID=354630 RepID=A0ABR6PMS7_9SPHI|nr:glycosyltransferase [Mucilaginibacter lappiensis]MBB6110916.1 glycosyltransferase involved in cell wall biosynthesis [Mucilaginibacter lappiensis]SIR60683.1 Glycosyltransferase involved in cell wall bisynthesis [Mucilaginibacter lappiensis]